MSGHTQESFPCGQPTVRGEIDIANATNCARHCTPLTGQCQQSIVDLSKSSSSTSAACVRSTSAAGY